MSSAPKAKGSVSQADLVTPWHDRWAVESERERERERGREREREKDRDARRSKRGMRRVTGKLTVAEGQRDRTTERQTDS